MQTESVAAAFARLRDNPWETCIVKWNWKSALTGALIRAGIFFATNLSAGSGAALGAMQAEFIWRLAMTGFYGSIIQNFRRAQPVWQANLITALLVPVLNHGIEFTIHYLRGTPNLKKSIIASVCFTILSMLFNSYAMRHGVLVTGGEGQSLAKDFQAMPRIIGGFLVWLLGSPFRLLQKT